MTIRSGFQAIFIKTLILVSLAPVLLSQSRDSLSIRHPESGALLPLTPSKIDDPPGIPSPYQAADGQEILTARTSDGKYLLIPVTVGDSTYGWGGQRMIDSGDFPTLAETGLHSEIELDQTRIVTGKTVSEITDIARPGRASSVGFMTDDEDLISVIKGDNRLVSRMGLTHPELALPLYQVCNLEAMESRMGHWNRGEWTNIEYFLYNGRKIYVTMWCGKGFQESIFNDEIRGWLTIDLRRDLDDDEKRLLRENYSHLTEEQMADLEKRLTSITTAEMEPAYIMRYGFYEGHSEYRTDPITIASVFSLKSLEEIEEAFPGRLYDLLTLQFTRETLAEEW